ncbi:MAG: hypothetical protein ACTSQB_05265 [Candidatus Heimdallarchaeota archaeon]
MNKLLMFMFFVLIMAVLSGCRVSYKSEIIGGFPKRDFTFEWYEEE